MNEEIVEYLNRYDLEPGSKWIVAVMVIGEQNVYTLEELRDFTDMEGYRLQTYLAELHGLQIVASEQGVENKHYFIVDIRIKNMAA